MSEFPPRILIYTAFLIRTERDTTFRVTTFFRTQKTCLDNKLVFSLCRRDERIVSMNVVDDNWHALSIASGSEATIKKSTSATPTSPSNENWQTLLFLAPSVP